MTAIITAIIGNIDTVKPVPEQTVRHTRLLFTEPAAGVEHLNPRNQALYYKTQIHQLTTADYYIWVDGKIEITSDTFIQDCIDQLGDGVIGILKHHERNCIYREVDHIEHCIAKGNPYLTPRYAHRPIREQVEAYRTQGFPANAGLFDCKIMISRKTMITELIYSKWWHECQMDWFDQISIRFLCWFYGVEIKPLLLTGFNDVPHGN